MFLLILDKNPYEAANLVPDRLKFKQLLELGQLICSAGISNVYKPINQGKKLPKWVKMYACWVVHYYSYLALWCMAYCNMQKESIKKVCQIRKDLLYYAQKDADISTAIFRYVKEYKSEYPSNTELSIDIAIIEYTKYVAWKEKRYVENKRKNK